MSYVELICASAFSFLEGASHPADLVAQAVALGYRALGVADVNTVSGVVQAHAAARAAWLRTLPGARLRFTDAPDIIAYPTDRAAWGRLCRLLSLGKGRAQKGECHLTFSDLCNWAEGQILIIIPPDDMSQFAAWLPRAIPLLPAPPYLAAIRRYAPDDLSRLTSLRDLGQAQGCRLLAGNDVLYHDPATRPLQDVMRCIRLGTTIEAAGTALEPHGERHLKPAAEMARLFAAFPEALAAQDEILARATFCLDEITYEYPDESTPPGVTPDEHLAALATAGAAARYPAGTLPKVQAMIEKELRLIAQLDYARYFLTVDDIVRYARSRNILCQGRGSAANSAVCYVLGITAVDPAQSDLLFERFLSAERREPPDIDVDFEHERREEVIQYLYNRYGRHRAAIAATVIHYRPKSAIREVGKVLGLAEPLTTALAAQSWNPGEDLWSADRLAEIGIDAADPAIAHALQLARQLVGLPRHLSQHVGGFVLTRGRLDETVPVGPAAMANRSFIEWDKNDIDALRMMKVDVLALGMLTCIRKCFAMLGIAGLADVPREDTATYDMLCRGDSLGVFQVESRAQMNMLPRLRPRTFYDLVIEVAIVRPGPIQGDMVHPYLRRRQGREPVRFPSPAPEHGPADELERVLGKTLGVPLFQEQAMRIAIEAAKFTPEKANALRRAMATFRNIGTIHKFQAEMVEGMVARGYDREFAAACFRQIEGFGTYGFPESHAASFALLVYVSSWLKCHHPAAFACALLNSQPMGFYAPAQIIRDAAAHNVTVREIDINASHMDCILEDGAVRLGFRLIDGFHAAWAPLIAAHRPYRTLDDLAALPRPALEHLAEADALRSLGLPRRLALWRIATMTAPSSLFPQQPIRQTMPDLPVMSTGEHVVADYRHTGFSIRAHPCALLRDKFTAARILTCAAANAARDGARVRIAGLVTVRQRPGTAKGTVFITLEDETGIANLIVWPALVETFRHEIIHASLLIADARLQRSPEGITHALAERLTDRTRWIADLDAPLAHADEFSKPRQPPSHPRHERVIQKSRDFH